MLHFRCKDLQCLKTKLQTHVEEDIQWTSPEIQNELTCKSCRVNLVLQRCMINVDETSHISRLEQVSLCLRYVVEGDTRDDWRIFCD